MHYISEIVYNLFPYLITTYTDQKIIFNRNKIFFTKVVNWLRVKIFSTEITHKIQKKLLLFLFK